MKIYLGGKMSGHRDGDNWRLSIVDGVEPPNEDLGNDVQGGSGANLYGGCGVGEPPKSWPILPNAILGRHDYVGPYLVRCDHGCYHSGDHATSVGWQGDDPEISAQREKTRQQIGNLCVHAMLEADLLFFWIDSLDAYGTLAELVFVKTAFEMGEAMRKEKGQPPIGKNIVLACPSRAAIDEMWLAFHLIGSILCLEVKEPKLALEAAIYGIEKDANLSPIEKMFMERWRAMYGNSVVSQYEVPGFRYRVDFAFPKQKVAIELDGYQYHSSKEQFTNDRKRQRDLEMAGWRFVRFSGSEIHNNLDACVTQAYRFWQAVKEGAA